MDNCRAIDMSFSYNMEALQETLEINDVWTLAPNIGKLRIAVMDQFETHRGWLDLTGGHVGGNQIIDIITPLIAGFEADYLVGFLLLTVQFTDLSSGSVDSWYWSFGGGTSSSIRNPQHVFSGPGAYTVSLTVTGPNGAEQRANIRVQRARL